MRVCGLCLRLDHIALDQAQRLSPMHTSCYGDEDMVSSMHYGGFVSGGVSRVGLSLCALNLGWESEAICIDGCWSPSWETGPHAMGRLCVH